MGKDLYSMFIIAERQKMSKLKVHEALTEKEERDGDMCRSCSAPAEEGHEPYCRVCDSYWKDCADGLWEFDDEQA